LTDISCKTHILIKNRCTDSLTTHTQKSQT